MKWRAQARQTLGLTLSDFERLTPAEIEIELEYARLRDDAETKERETLLRLIDTHLATMETLFYNAHFRTPAKVADFKLLKDPARNISAGVLALDAKLRARAQAKFNKKGEK